jgi:hypothetical protein
MPDPAEFEEREDLSATERQRMAEGLRLKAALVHEIIREEGEEELARSVSALAWSGLAADLAPRGRGWQLRDTSGIRPVPIKRGKGCSA